MKNLTKFFVGAFFAVVYAGVVGIVYGTVAVALALILIAVFASAT
jgi:hypothetical protein